MTGFLKKTGGKGGYALKKKKAWGGPTENSATHESGKGKRRRPEKNLGKDITAMTKQNRQVAMGS